MNEHKIYCTSPILEVDDEDRKVSPMFSPFFLLRYLKFLQNVVLMYDSQ